MKLALHNVRVPLHAMELHLDCTIEGKITAVFGPTGAGKTSMLEVIAGLRPTTDGKITLGDKVLQDSSEKIFTPPRKRNVGYVPQDLALFPHKTVSENIAYGECPSRDHHISLDGLCDALEINHLLSRMPNTLSGGEKQRVAFARALTAKPKILLLDEPLSSLDYSLKQRIIPYILLIRDEFKIPIIYITHSSDEVMAICDEALILQSGKIRDQGNTKDLFVKSDIPLYLPRAS
ncbi:MAG: ATP-binding cassette domain-containing protein [Chthoniobacterales bacterium]